MTTRNKKVLDFIRETEWGTMGSSDRIWWRASEFISMLSNLNNDTINADYLEFTANLDKDELLFFHESLSALLVTSTSLIVNDQNAKNAIDNLGLSYNYRKTNFTPFYSFTERIASIDHYYSESVPSLLGIIDSKRRSTVSVSKVKTMPQEIPNLLFKYRSVESEKSLNNTIEILKNHRLYFPNRNKLNDPLEGVNTRIALSTAGQSITKSMDEESGPVAAIRDEYRILSLSSNPLSAAMWAHYCDNYNGICIGFFTNEAFPNVKRVRYNNHHRILLGSNPTSKQLHWVVEDDYLTKKTDWSYEKEWRVVERTEEEFYAFDNESLACVIISPNIEKAKITEILAVIPEEVPILVIHSGMFSGKMYLMPFRRRVSTGGDGRPRFQIETVEDLEDYLEDDTLPAIYRFIPTSYIKECEKETEDLDIPV